jgi:hypothetical protein
MLRTLFIVALLASRFGAVLALSLVHQWLSVWLLLGAGLLIESIAHNASEE